MALLTRAELVKKLLNATWQDLPKPDLTPTLRDPAELPENWKVYHHVGQWPLVFKHKSGHASVLVHEAGGVSECVQEVGSLSERATLHRDVSSLLDALDKATNG